MGAAWEQVRSMSIVCTDLMLIVLELEQVDASEEHEVGQVMGLALIQSVKGYIWILRCSKMRPS